MSKKIIVTIDGPAGAGKSTTAKAVAEKTGLPYLDTGALYRAVAWKLDKEGVAPEDGGKIAETLKDFKIEVAGGKVTAAELDAKVAELRKEHFTLRQQSKTGTLENPARIGQIRKDIARCLTEKKIRGAAVQA